MHRDEVMEGSEYSKIRVCQVSSCANIAQGPEYASICLNNTLWQGSEYSWSTFHRVLNKAAVLNMLGFRIWQGCKYARVTQGTEYA